jgi:hypothetical protein
LWKKRPPTSSPAANRPGQRATGGVEHARVVVHPHAAERERDPARDGEGSERRLLDGSAQFDFGGSMPSVRCRP